METAANEANIFRVWRLWSDCSKCSTGARPQPPQITSIFSRENFITVNLSTDFCHRAAELEMMLSLSVPDNAQLRVYYARISVFTHRCGAYAPCGHRHIFWTIETNDSESETSSESETTLYKSDSCPQCWLDQKSLPKVLPQSWLVENSCPLPLSLYRFPIW